MTEEMELRMFSMDCASELDNECVEDMVDAAEIIYLWITTTSPETRISVDKKGNLNVDPNDN